MRCIFFYLDQNSNDEKIKKKHGQSLVPFLSIFGNHFGAHFGTRSAKEGARWAQESHQELQRAKKLHFQKPWKTYSFLVFLDAEASQENFKRPEKAPKRHPKRHPKVVQNLVKKWLKSEPKNEQTNTISMLKISLRPVGTLAVFVAMGPSKNAYLKMSKIDSWIKFVAKNGPKMIPKWFKIAQIA